LLTIDKEEEMMNEIRTGDIVQNISTGTIGKVFDICLIFDSVSSYHACLNVDCENVSHMNSPVVLWKPVEEEE